jgi:hypothetical protein
VPSFNRVSPPLAASVLLGAMVAGLLRASLALTGGPLVYPLDDAYIHVAVARNLAEHGVWGVTRHGFTSSTSSLAWPLLLATAHAVFGAVEAMPLILNAIAGVLCLAAAAVFLHRYSAWWRLAVLLAIVLFTPLPTLVLIGMEHTLHVCAVLLLAGLVARTVERDEGHPSFVLLAVAAALATSLRYESLFLVAASMAVLGRRRRYGAAIAVAAGGLAPVVGYALLSVSRGWYPLPNSVLLKGARFDPTTTAGIVDLLGGRSLRMLAQTPHLLVLVIVCLALLTLRGPRRTLPTLAVTTTLLHLQFADVGWLYRYEAYLVALGLVAIGACAPEAGATVRGACTSGSLTVAATVALAAVVAYPLTERAVRATAETPRAAKNIFDQQYQMGLFFRRFYPGASIAANDIGAVTALADVRLLDLYGLASMDVARARRAGTLDRETVARLAAAQETEVVAVYRSWFGPSLPPEWLEAGSWRAPEKVVIADRVVTFYARDVEGRDRLAWNLAAFASVLPADVAVRVPGRSEAP